MLVDLITDRVATATTLDGVRDGLIEALEKAKSHSPARRLEYVAGIITSEGPARQEYNLARLVTYTNHIRSQRGHPVFSATDVFNAEVFEQIKATSYSQEAWLQFWRMVLTAKVELAGGLEPLVTDVTMTPRWHISRGATDEESTARAAGLNVNYQDPLPGWE